MARRQRYTVGGLIKVLATYNPNTEVRVWDLGYGDHVPAVEVTDDTAPAFIIIEGATKEEMDRGAFGS